MEEIVIIIILVFGILNIILFFKIWGMTDNTRRIRELMEDIADIEEYKYKERHKNKSVKNKNNTKDIKTDIELYSWITEIRSRKEFQVMEIIDKDTFLCVNDKNQDGIKLKRSEIEKS